jgi:hypothetical protein
MGFSPIPKTLLANSSISAVAVTVFVGSAMVLTLPSEDFSLHPARINKEINPAEKTIDLIFIVFPYI